MVLRLRYVPVLCALALLLISSETLFSQRASVAGSTAGLAALPALSPVSKCEKLSAEDISLTVGSPTHITSATVVKDGQPAPYCDVQGYVEPAVKFEVRLPLDKWAQRYLQTGCGGLCGVLNIQMDDGQSCTPYTNGQVATASTDMGHEGGMDGVFGAEDYQLRIDFAYRGVHVTALAAKALIQKFYGQGPKYSYFSGCSDGGREALMEAERFPNDFSGITAGAPAMSFTTQNSFYHGWNVLANQDANGELALTADKLPILHKAAVEQCDAQDGVKDGLISNPFACRFDPSVIECKPGQDAASCLTPAQARTAQKLYAGAYDGEGNRLTLSGPLPGSELAWEGVLIPAAGSSSAMSGMISSGALKHLLYDPDPPESYALKELKFDKASFAATTRLHGLYDATDPDLAAFESAGGKLILWHGLADPHISPLNTVAYYTAVQQLLGKEKVDGFARLFLFPGGYHCSEGEGPFEFDLLTAIMAWVERGEKPDVLIASRTSGGQPAKIDRTRSVYPYPYSARYTGTGSADEARNYVKGPAQPVDAERLKWLGSSFFTPHYELWCTGKGLAMECKKTEN
jgi:feruloyl esterase